jgi:hypothetical protein
MDTTNAATVRGKKIPTLESDRLQLIKDSHEMGHFGVQRTFLRIWHKGYWWPRMRTDILKELDNCMLCLRHTVKKTGFHPIKPIITGFPNDGWSIDLAFLPRTSKKGYNAIMVAIDNPSGFNLALTPLEAKKTTIVADIFWKLVCLFGPFKFVISHNGGEFTSAYFKKLMKRIKIKHRLIASYNPSANGRVERAIKDIKLAMSTPDNWPLYIPFAMYCFNTRINSRTNS